MEDKIMKFFINQLIGKNIKINDTWKKMVKKGQKLANINSDKIVEIPMSLQGLKACKVLSGDKYNINLLFSTGITCSTSRSRLYFSSY